MVCKRVFLSGKVQGVSFRFHAHEQATAAHLKGWVRNLADGRVEMLLFGTPGAVEGLVTWARKGPPTAKVERVEVVDAKEPEPHEPFFIRRDGGKP